MAFAFLKNLVAGTNENVSDVMTDLNQIKDELNGATATSTMTIAGDVTGSSAASLLSKITGNNTRFGTGGALISNASTFAEFSVNYNPATDRLIDTTKAAGRFYLDSSSTSSAVVIDTAAATAGAPSWTHLLTMDTSGVISTATATPPANSVTSAMIVNGTIVDADVNAANKDGAAGTASLRTLGAGATQAMAGNATPGGVPSGAAGGSLAGTYPNPTLAAATVSATTLTTLPSAGIFHTGANNSTTQTLTDGTRAVVLLDGVGWDVGTGSAQAGSNRLTCRQTGRYAIGANVEFAGPGGGAKGSVSVELRLNGTTYLARNGYAYDSTDNGTYNIDGQATRQYPLTSGDYVEVVVISSMSTVANVNLLRNANYAPEMWWQYMGPT